jgi:hypothetical protein
MNSWKLAFGRLWITNAYGSLISFINSKFVLVRFMRLHYVVTTILMKALMKQLSLGNVLSFMLPIGTLAPVALTESTFSVRKVGPMCGKVMPQICFTRWTKIGRCSWKSWRILQRLSFLIWYFCCLSQYEINVK